VGFDGVEINMIRGRIHM